MFQLNFASGAFVSFHAWHWFGQWYFANVQVQAAPDDYSKTKGLCGTWDGDQSDDFTANNGQPYNYQNGVSGIASTDFTESWK